MGHMTRLFDASCMLIMLQSQSQSCPWFATRIEVIEQMLDTDAQESAIMDQVDCFFGHGLTHTHIAMETRVFKAVLQEDTRSNHDLLSLHHQII